MKCDLCQGEYHETRITLTFHRDGETVVIEDVPAKVCDRCGDTLLSEAVVRQAESLVEHEPAGTATLYHFPPQVLRPGWACPMCITYDAEVAAL